MNIWITVAMDMQITTDKLLQSVFLYGSSDVMRGEGFAREIHNSIDYRLFKIHHVTKLADVEDFVLCVIVTEIECYNRS
jgi:hypothetical protein